MINDPLTYREKVRGLVVDSLTEEIQGYLAEEDAAAAAAAEADAGPSSTTILAGVLGLVALVLVYLAVKE